jgi:hypothetical protein
MMKERIIIVNDLRVEVKSPSVIESNFEEMEQALSEQMQLYKDLEITENKNAEAKKDLATLRKIRKAIDDKRKEVKKEFMKPFDDFEAKVKNLIDLVDEPISLIDTKVQKFEKKRKAERQAQVIDIYIDAIGDYQEYLPYDYVSEPSWLNISTSDKEIRADISEAIVSTRNAIDTLTATDNGFLDKALDLYKKTHDLPLCVSRAVEWKKVADEAAAKAVEEQKPQQAVAPVQQEQDSEEPELPFTDESTIKVTYAIVGTAEQITELEATMVSLDVYWEKRV